MNKGGAGLGLTLPALSFALSLDRIMNGICRPFFGWVSDTIGRELTMFILRPLRKRMSVKQAAIRQDTARPIAKRSALSMTHEQ